MGEQTLFDETRQKQTDEEGQGSIDSKSEYPQGSDYPCYDDGCYVAGSVYTEKAPQIWILRQYRDNVLSKSSAGRAAVRAYYNGLGKTTAGILRGVPFARGLVRKFLDFFIDHIQY